MYSKPSSEQALKCLRLKWLLRVLPANAGTASVLLGTLVAAYKNQSCRAFFFPYHLSLSIDISLKSLSLVETTSFTTNHLCLIPSSNFNRLFLPTANKIHPFLITIIGVVLAPMAILASPRRHPQRPPPSRLHKWPHGPPDLKPRALPSVPAGILPNSIMGAGSIGTPTKLYKKKRRRKVPQAWRALVLLGPHRERQPLLLLLQSLLIFVIA